MNLHEELKRLHEDRVRDVEAAAKYAHLISERAEEFAREAAKAESRAILLVNYALRDYSYFKEDEANNGKKED